MVGRAAHESNRHPRGLHPRPVAGLGTSCPTIAALIGAGRTHVVCHGTRLSGSKLQHDARGCEAHPAWNHDLPGRVVAVTEFGLQEVAVLLDIDGIAVLGIVTAAGYRPIASEPGTPVAVATLGARLAFAVTGANQHSTITVVQASGQIIARVSAAALVSGLAYDARQDLIVAFSARDQMVCWIRYTTGGRAASVPQRFNAPIPERGADTARKQLCCCCPVPLEPDPAPCGCGGQGGGQCGGQCGGGQWGGGGNGNGPRDPGTVRCEPGGPGVIDGCFAYIVIDGLRVVRIDLCRPTPRCETPMDRPVQHLRKAGAYLVGQGDGGRFMTVVDPTTMRIILSRALPRGGSILASHPSSDELLMFDTRLGSWHAMDLAAVAAGVRDTKTMPAARRDAGSLFGVP